MVNKWKKEKERQEELTPERLRPSCWDKVRDAVHNVDKRQAVVQLEYRN